MARKKNRKTKHKTLESIYYNYGNVGALQNSPRKLLTLLQKQHPNAKITDVTTFLSKQPSYTVHHRAPNKNFLRRSIRVLSPRARYDGDLLELRDLKPWNSGFQYAFIVIDVFTRYVWSKALKNKEATTTATAWSELIQESHMPPPLTLYTDAGREFVGTAFQNALKQHGGSKHRVCSANDYHCPFVERVIRTLKEKLFQAMTSEYTRRWVDLLPRIVDTYNKTSHSSTKFTPLEASDPKNFLNVVYNSVPLVNNQISKYKFKIGDYIRILKARSALDKGYLPRFTWEIFRVKAYANTNQPTDKQSVPAYILEDLDGEEIQHAVFYEPEMVYIHPNQLQGPTPIREILKQRDNEVLVWFQGQPKSKAVWIPRTRLVSSRF